MIRCLIDGQPYTWPTELALNFHGHSVFTTLRSQNHEPIFWQQHWQRLKNHAEAFHYSLPDEENLYRLIIDELKKLKVDQKVRVIIARNHFMLTFEPFQTPLASVYDGNERVIFSRWQVHPQLARYKTGNSLPYSLAQAEAHKANAFEALMLNSDGYVVDGSRTSIMVFHDDALIVLEGGLHGIMREAAVDFLKNRGISIKRAYLKPQEIFGQILLSNCLFGVIPIGPIRSSVIKDMIAHFHPK